MYAMDHRVLTGPRHGSMNPNTFGSGMLHWAAAELLY